MDPLFAEKYDYCESSIATFVVRLNCMKQHCIQSNMGIADLFKPYLGPQILQEMIPGKSVQTVCSCARLLILLNKHLDINGDPKYMLELEAWCQVVESKRRNTMYTYTTRETILKKLHESDISPMSKECLIVRIILEAPVRDDLQVAYIREDNFGLATNFVGYTNDKNYLFWFEDRPTLILLINRTKNIKLYGPQQYVLPENLSANIKHYAKTDPYAISHAPFIFGLGKHSMWVKGVLKKLGFDEMGAINFLRRAVAESAKQSGDANIIAKTCIESFHRPSTSKLYYENPN